MNPVTAEVLKERLAAAFGTQIEVEDESHLHVGHAGAKDGGKHFRVKVITPKFEGLNTIARHRLVYDAVSDWMNKEIHALAITAQVPDQPR